MCLCGENDDKIAFSDDGKSVILTVKSPGWVNIDNPTKAKAFMREKIQYKDNVNFKWFDQYIISHINKNEESGTY